MSPRGDAAGALVFIASRDILKTVNVRRLAMAAGSVGLLCIGGYAVRRVWPGGVWPAPPVGGIQKTIQPMRGSLVALYAHCGREKMDYRVELDGVVYGTMRVEKVGPLEPCVHRFELMTTPGTPALKVTSGVSEGNITFDVRGPKSWVIIYRDPLPAQKIVLDVLKDEPRFL